MPIRSVAWVVVVCALATSVVEAFPCRQGPASQTQHCGLPVELANFQGYYPCEEEVQLGRPQTKADILDMISYYDSVRGVGVGHSWWQEQFCSGNDSSSINIVTTELNSTLAMIINPTYPIDAPPDFPIQVNEATQTVTAQAGVPQRLLLDYLAKYTSPLAPMGYSLPAFPWYIDQSIGGAVSTGTHGSSLWYGSLASQVVRIEMALANATLVNLTEASTPHLWHAAQTSVGRLGVITEVELMIKSQSMITRTGFLLSFDQFVAEIHQLQADWTGALAGTNGLTVGQVQDAWEATQLFWFVPDSSIYKVQYSDLGPAPVDAGSVTTQSVGKDEPEVKAANPSADTLLGGPATAQPPSEQQAAAILAAEGRGPRPEDVFAQVPTPDLGPSLLFATQPLLWNTIYRTIITSFFPNGTFTNRMAILAENEFANRQTSDQDPYDQYELSVPVSTAGDCLQLVADAMYGQGLTAGFAVPPLIRFVGAEDAYLSTSYAEPRIYFNIEDHLSKSQLRDNVPFQQIMGVFMDQCKARMHWGKAGWARWYPCFDGATVYPDTWCDFGCAVQELDPTGKFSSISNIWSWSAAQGGQSVPFASCCTSEGFSPACTCAPRTDCAFTNRVGSA